MDQKTQSGNDLDLVRRVGERIFYGGSITFEESLAFLEREDLDPYELFYQANRVREKTFGNRVHFCSIVNAKSGNCSEDCGFCAQSAHFKTAINHYSLIDPDEMAAAAERASTYGSVGLGVVTATRGFRHDKDRSFFTILDGLRKIRDQGLIEPHASLGLLGAEEFRLLKEAGLREYNHNLETGRSYFGEICTTHTYEERIETIRHAKNAGIRTCVGGILGMGERPFHRVELAFTLKELDVDEVPLNFLVSVEGTKIEKANPLKPLEMLKHISVFRLILPEKNIFICAGRHHLGDLQAMIFYAGASGIMVGDFLTTKNRSVDDDIKMIRDLGFELTRRQGGEASPRQPA